MSGQASTGASKRKRVCLASGGTVRPWQRKREVQVRIGSEGSCTLGGFRTDVPAVIGIVISNTMILAVKVVASGTIDVDGHRTLPTFK